MDRKEFLRKTMITGTVAAIVPATVQASKVNAESSTYDRLMEQVGFNHLPNQERITMNTVLHPAASRGHANHGWLNSHHSFSFANYHNPNRMHFGVLRVLNDDQVAAGKGFGTHPHDNMEIISIPLEGDLEHKDSMGNIGVIKQGDVQAMSAGTGIFHSEYNKNQDREVKFLQIWVFPNQKQVEPRYDQISIDSKKMINQFYQILSPNANDEGVWIHQNAWFHLGHFDKGQATTYTMKDPKNGLYAFVLNGEITLAGQELTTRDGFGIWNTTQVDFSTRSDAKVLLMEVPMQLG